MMLHVILCMPQALQSGNTLSYLDNLLSNCTRQIAIATNYIQTNQCKLFKLELITTTVL